MQVACLKNHGRVFHVDLTNALDKDSSRIRCFVRHTSYKITPEEKVRQSLLWFLLNGSQQIVSWKPNISIDVERFDIDISLSIIPETEGFDIPFYFLIIETKKDTHDCSLLDEKQIQKYLCRKHCQNGLWYNGSNAIYLKRDKVGRRLSKTTIQDMSEIEDLIINLGKTCFQGLELQERFFLDAMNGDFEAFLQLSQIYGKRATMGFECQRDGKLYRQRGFLFHSDRDSLSYKIPGISTKKRQILSKSDFRGLFSIMEGR